MTHKGNRYLRYYLCEAANSVRMRHAEYAAYYSRKFHKVRKHQHKCPVRGINELSCSQRANWFGWWFGC